MRIFLVDDAAIVREQLTDLIAPIGGMEIVGESSGSADAEEKIRQLKPDVVILDLRLPDGSGIEILKKIKKFDPSPKVIIFSNNTYPQYEQRCMGLGADFFFNKAEDFRKIPRVLLDWSEKAAL